MAKKKAANEKPAISAGKPPALRSSCPSERQRRRISKGGSLLVDTRVIYCGDNLDQLKKFPAHCVDLIYIDPPFNSNRNYEVFRGETEPIRITRSLRGRAKSTRTRRWGKIPTGVVKTTLRTILTRQRSHRALQPAAVERVIRIGSKEKRAFEDRHASTQAYIDFMRPRCIELHRVLKQTGSFYYHCDWHASHYVKIMLDHIFGENQFKTEIIWRRTSS
jgi:site-specific DNA-methyltransferase (adenine-specific)